MGKTHGCSLHPIYQSLGLWDAGWDGYSHLLGFYLKLISTLDNIRYLVTSSPSVSNMSTVISYFGDISEKCCTEYDVTCNVVCEII